MNFQKNLCKVCLLSLCSFIFVLFLLLFTSTQVYATTYFVMQNGSGNYTTIQNCATAAVAGDTCLVYNGSYNERVTPAHSGTATNYITFNTSGNAKVRGFDLSDRQYIILNGFEILNDGFSADTDGPVVLKSTNNTIITNNYIHNATSFGSRSGAYIVMLNTYFGVNSTPFPYNFSNNNTIRNNNLSLCSQNSSSPCIGITVYGNNNLVEKNDISHLGDDFTRVVGGRFNVLRNNSFHDNTQNDFVYLPLRHIDAMQSFTLLSNFYNGTEIDYPSVKYTLIENNHEYNNPSNDTHFVIFQNYGMLDYGDFLIRYNTVDGNGDGFMVNDVNTTNVRAYSNTISRMAQQSPAWETLGFTHNSTGGQFINNILYDAARDDSDGYSLDSSTQNNFSAHNNLAYTTSCDTSCIWQSPISTETNVLLNKNPQLKDLTTFTLNITSPAIDKGSYLTNVSVSDTGSGTTLIVNNAGFFQDGWAGTQPDWIAVGNAANIVQISSINYLTNTITLANTINRSANNPVYLYQDSSGRRVLYGNTPDIGANEYNDVVAPLVSLTAPNNAAVGATAQLNFSATFTDDLSLANATLFVWNSTNALINQTTVNIIGVSNSSNVSITLPRQDIYHWNYLVCDANANCAWNATNYTFTYSTANLSAGLIAYWSFEAGSGNNATNFSGNSLTATFVGKPTWNYGRVGNYSLSLNGSTDYMTVPTFNSTNSTGITVSAWINPTKFLLFTYQGLVTNKGSIPYAVTVQFNLNNSAGQLWFNDGAQTGSAFLANAIWQHVVFSANSSGHYLYINNSQVYSDNVSWTPRNPLEGGFDIGSKIFYTTFGGGLDDLRIYNRSLDSSEITALYNLGSDPYYPQFSNYVDNNQTLIGPGLALFNVTVNNTNGTVLLQINNSNYTATNAGSNIFTVAINLSNGTYNYIWYAFGNGTNARLNNSPTINYVIFAPGTDRTFPIFSNYSDNNATMLGAGVAKFNVTIVNTNGTVILQISNTTNSVTNNVNYTATNISSTIYTVSVNLTNATYNYIWYSFGNGTSHVVNNSPTRTYLLNDTDILPPQITIVSPTNGSYAKKPVLFNLSSNEQLNVCVVSWDSWATNYTMTRDATWFYANFSTTNISEGLHTANFACNDTSNNTNATQKTTFTVDGIAPVVTIINPQNNSVFNISNQLTFTYNVSDANNVDNCSLLMGNKIVLTNTTITKNTNQTMAYYSPNANGGNWSIACTDQAKNIGTATIYNVTTSADLISIERRIDWSKNAGLNFVIPTYPIGRNAKNDDGAVGDGVADDTAAIRSCIKNTPTNTSCYVPPGTYKLEDSVALYDVPSGTNLGGHKSLVGAGADKTHFIADSNVSTVFYGYTFSEAFNMNVVAGATKGSTRIYVNASDPNLVNYAPGNLIMVDQGPGDGEENVPGYIPRPVGQMDLVTGVGSNYIDLQSPMYYDYNMSLNVQISNKNTAVTQIGIENISIDRVQAGSGSGKNVWMSGCVNCWVRNITTKNVWNWHVSFERSYGDVVRDSWFEQTWQYNCGGNACYGTSLYDKTSDAFVYNNVYIHMRHAMITESGGAGNIFAYGYSREPINENGLTTDYLMGDLTTHGGYPFMNLWEGNVGGTLKTDIVLGSSTANTFYRNNVEVKGLNTTYVAMFAVDDQASNQNENFVGNLFGSSGKMTQTSRLGCNQDTCSGNATWNTAYTNQTIPLPDARVNATILMHGNYDFRLNATVWDPNVPQHTLPNSLVYNSTPSWWPTNLAWPPFDGTNRSSANNLIPAQIRYLIFIANDTTPPVVNITAPANKTITATGSITFNSTFTDDQNLSSATLYVWNSQNSTVNQTLVVKTGTSNSSSIFVNLPYQDLFHWNYYVCDFSGNCAWGTNNLTVNYSDINVTAGLVGYWKLDESNATTAIDSSGNNNSGAFQGSFSPPVPGKIGGAFNFGFNLVQVTNPSGNLDFGTNSFSFSEWIYGVTGDTGQQHRGPLVKGIYGAYSGYAIQGIWGTSGASMQAVISDANNSAASGFGQKNLLNTWSLLTVVVNRSDNTLKTYIDGVYTGNSADTSAVSSVTTNQPLQIGMGSNWAPYFGVIDDVRVYNRSLSAQDVQRLYFIGQNTATLSVSMTGTGAGNVTGINGSTINCGSSCFQTVIVGTNITINATPDAESFLQNWSYPGCTGNGTCTINMTSDVNLVANFKSPAEERKIINATTCSQADVQAAIDSSRNGNTVLIPPGNCVWGDWVNGSNAVVVAKAIKLVGSGQNLTFINISTSAPTYNNGVVQIYAAAVVAGFTINQSGANGSTTSAFSGGGVNGWRITNVTYNNPNNNAGYFVYAGTYGVIDSNLINAGGGSDELIFSRGPVDSWQTPNSIGGADNLFIEDNVFNNPGYVSDCNSNSRCVIRFNTITGSMKIDGHGKASNSPPRGVRHMEVYDNVWTNDTNAAIEIRGGGGRVFGNTAYISSWFFLTDYAASAAWPNFNNTIQTPADYPIDDQIGVGMDPKVGGSEPMYLWSNRKNVNQLWDIGLSYTVPYSTMSQIIATDRDYFNESTTFNGSTGVGVGTLAQMNAITPTTNGVGFWVTNQGKWNLKSYGYDGELYVWNGSSWNLNYVPYPYPNPLRLDFNPNDTTAPIVNITAPVNNLTTLFATTSYNVSFTDNYNLGNATLYIWNSSNSIVNQTTVVKNGTSNTSSINVTLPYQGIFHWNYYICDYSGNCAWNSNANTNVTVNNFTINYVIALPAVQITYPQNTTYSSIIHNLNYTVNGSLVSNCWYSTNSGVTNTTIACGTNVTNLNATQGSNTWKVFANDTLGNFASTSVTFFVDSIAPTQLNQSAFALTNESVRLNLTTDEISNVTINYGTTLALGTLQFNTTNATFHQIKINGLQNGTLYYYNISYTDPFGNTATNGTYNFTTYNNFTLAIILNTSEWLQNETTNFSQYKNAQALNLTNVTFSNTYGQISYLNNISVERTVDLTNKISVTVLQIAVNSSVLPEFNTTAQLTFKNVTLTTPIIKKDGLDCVGANCTNATFNKTTHIYTFGVPSFSTYNLVEQCTDGIQNYDEAGVDCGGANCGACPSAPHGPSGGGGGGGGAGGMSGFIAPPVTNSTTNSTNSTTNSSTGASDSQNNSSQNSIDAQNKNSQASANQVNKNGQQTPQTVYPQSDNLATKYSFKLSLTLLLSLLIGSGLVCAGMFYAPRFTKQKSAVQTQGANSLQSSAIQSSTSQSSTLLMRNKVQDARIKLKQNVPQVSVAQLFATAPPKVALMAQHLEKYLAAGYNNEQLISMCVAKGWQKETIVQILQKINQTNKLNQVRT